MRPLPSERFFFCHADLPVGQVCTADCNGNNMVAVNELVTCVGIVLGNTDPSVCPACDGNGDGNVGIADLVGGVGNLLTGCPEPVDTPTPEPTETPDTTETPDVTETPEATETPTEAATPTVTQVPTATVPPIDVTEPVAGSVALIANGMGVVPSIVSAIATGITIGGGVGSEGAGAGADPCPLNGSVLMTGSFPPVLAPLTITLAGCEVEMATGSAVFDGAITLSLSGLSEFDVTAQLTAVL